jgi:hypothetical protein
MARGEIRLKQHDVHPDRQVAEIWYDGVMLATVTVAEEHPTVRVISKYLTRPEQAWFNYGDALLAHVEIRLR